MSADLLAERNQIDQQLEALDEATSFGEYESPDQAAKRHELNVKWLEVTDQIEAGQTEIAKAEEARASALPDVPTNFDELKRSTAELRERVLDLRVEAEEGAEAVKALPVGSARRIKAERDAQAALVRAREASEDADSFWEEHQLRLSTEKLIADVSASEARRRWAQAHDATIIELQRLNDEALRAGKAGYETEIRRVQLLKQRPPDDEYIEAVRADMIASKAIEASGFDRAKLGDAVTAAKRTNNPYALAAGKA